MKKDKEWLKNEINNVTSRIFGADFSTLKETDNLIDQLEPELTQVQVDKYLHERNLVAVDEMMIHQTGMQNKVVVEKPVIPQFVADWIEENEYLTLMYIGFELFSNKIKDEDVNDWIRNNQEQFCRAFLAWPNVEVEKEKKYRVKLTTSGSGVYMYRNVVGNIEFSTFKHQEFTEQEIKAIDERYWAFSEEVTE